MYSHKHGAATHYKFPNYDGPSSHSRSQLLIQGSTTCFCLGQRPLRGGWVGCGGWLWLQVKPQPMSRLASMGYLKRKVSATHWHLKQANKFNRHSVEVYMTYLSRWSQVQGQRYVPAAWCMGSVGFLDSHTVLQNRAMMRSEWMRMDDYCIYSLYNV